jgi:beta-xylosidase
VAYSSIPQAHKVSLDVLTPNFTASTGKNLGQFPDSNVEGGAVFKRNGLYYMGYGACCCFCRGGSGWVVYQAKSIDGPWTRQVRCLL